MASIFFPPFCNDTFIGPIQFTHMQTSDIYSLVMCYILISSVNEDLPTLFYSSWLMFSLDVWMLLLLLLLCYLISANCCVYISMHKHSHIHIHSHKQSFIGFEQHLADRCRISLNKTHLHTYTHYSLYGTPCIYFHIFIFFN